LAHQETRRHGSENQADPIVEFASSERLPQGPETSESVDVDFPAAALKDSAEFGWRERNPPTGSIGYTGSYRERSVDVIEVSVVSVLEARGPE
jgi:hypothetical protein